MLDNYHGFKFQATLKLYKSYGPPPIDLNMGETDSVVAGLIIPSRRLTIENDLRDELTRMLGANLVKITDVSHGAHQSDLRVNGEVLLKIDCRSSCRWRWDKQNAQYILQNALEHAFPIHKIHPDYYLEVSDVHAWEA